MAALSRLYWKEYSGAEAAASWMLAEADSDLRKLGGCSASVARAVSCRLSRLLLLETAPREVSPISCCRCSIDNLSEYKDMVSS